MKHIARIKIGAYCCLVLYIAHMTGFFDQVALSWPIKNLKLAMRMPESFGKTHFIVGYAEKQQQANRHKAVVNQPIDSNALTYTVLFSPDDDVRGALLDLIEHERSSIKMATFTFTDEKVACALVDAQNRGIDITLITDGTCLKDRNNKIAFLCGHNIKVFVYNASDETGRKNNNSLMHHKFIIFENNRSDKSLVCTGSCNTTKSAYQFNQENMVIIQNDALVDRYVSQFERLKGRAYRYGSIAKRHWGHK